MRYDRLVKLELPSDEYLLIDKLMMNFLTETNHCSSGKNLARTARGFFQRVQELSREMLNSEFLKQLNDFEKNYKIVIEDSFTAQGTNVETEDPNEGKPSEIVTFDDIGGYQHIVEDLRFIVDTFKNPQYEAFNYKRPRGICFYGRPGTGKTLLGKAIACESDRPFHYLNVAQVLSKWVGESEKKLQNSLMKSGIHFLDEANSILGVYSQQDNATNERLIDIFAEAVNGYKSNPDAMYILATNTLKLNKKVKRAGRVDIYYEFGLPDAQAIYHVLNIHLNKLTQGASVPIVNGLDLNVITRAIYSTSVIANRKNANLGIVPADCENILKRTHEKKVKDYWKSGQFIPMGTEDVLEIVKNYNLEARE
jgi:SpoVK/Ycf46/Vps4 family AAA+-type ATPase